MKSILIFFITTFPFSLFSQNKYYEKDLIGVWNIELNSENENAFNKEESLKYNSFGYHFQENNVLIIRTVDRRSQCASPLSYKNIEANWTILNNSIIEISNVESQKLKLNYTILKLKDGILILNPISEKQKLTTEK